MLSSAAFTLTLGLAATFSPESFLNQPVSVQETLIAQAAGALYLGFAMMNWMARESLIGGIYSRPVAMGNLLHFVILALALTKVAASQSRTPQILGLTVVYITFAIGFGCVVFGDPLRNRKPESQTA